MNKAKLKVLVMALKEIIEELESEIYSDPESYTTPDRFNPSVMADYDEVFDDDDGYPD
jgi:hypothetical protein